MEDRGEGKGKKGMNCRQKEENIEKRGRKAERMKEAGHGSGREGNRISCRRDITRKGRRITTARGRGRGRGRERGRQAAMTMGDID